MVSATIHQLCALALAGGIATSTRLVAQSVELLATPDSRVAALVVPGAVPRSSVRAPLVIIPADGEAVVEVLGYGTQIVEAVDSVNGQPTKVEVSLTAAKLTGGRATCALQFSRPDDVPSGLLKVSGVIRMKSAHGRVTRQSALCVVRDQADVKVGGILFTLGKVAGDDRNTRITMVAHEPLVMVKDLRFTSSGGEPLAATCIKSVTRQGVLGDHEESRTFTIAGNVESLRVVVDLFDKTKPVDVPFEVLVPVKP